MFVHDVIEGFRRLEDLLDREWDAICNRFPGHKEKRRRPKEPPHIICSGIIFNNLKVEGHIMGFTIPKGKKIVLPWIGNNAEGLRADFTGLSVVSSDPTKVGIGTVDQTGNTSEVLGLDLGDVTITPTGLDVNGNPITGSPVTITVTDNVAVTIVPGTPSDPIAQ